MEDRLRDHTPLERNGHGDAPVLLGALGRLRMADLPPLHALSPRAASLERCDRFDLEAKP